MQKMRQAIGQMNLTMFQNIGQTTCCKISKSICVGTSSRTETQEDFFLEKFLYYKDSEALKQVAQTGCELLNPGGAQDQAEWGSE